MPVNTTNLRRHLRAFEWKPLFIEVLHWSNPTERAQPVQIDEQRFTITPVAQMGGMHVYTCVDASGTMPASATRKAIENQVKERQYEHIIIFEDGARQQAIFQWMKRGQGAARSREYAYTRNQSGDQLLQRLGGIAFEFADLDDEGKIDIIKVVERVAKSLDVESVTKKFYDEFTRQRDAFQKFMAGIPATADDDARWYVSVMLNRLMFIYFVQTKGFLAGDPDYLKNKLEWSKAHLGAGGYFRNFLQVLFFEGFAKEETERTPAVQTLLGKIPYLNGGLFIKHPLEEKYGAALDIADEAFEKLFAFFGNWRWHLSERPGDHQNEIDPDVLGYIFEKYINQKQMGAYYTKDDITGYICRNTIIPRLFDKADLSLAPLKLPQTIRAYLYPAVTQRDHLPTETEREYRARQERAARLIAEAEAGTLATINDAITANLNVEALIYDLVPTLDAHATKRLYDALATLSVLDPTCGSGAFLFAAIKILKPIYEQVLERMAILIDRRQTAGLPFKEILDAEQAHANRDYFVTKSIVVRNLYGVDIMEEATEICKLRLFLRLVADLDDAAHIEPLPDIDFNIRAGNALVGYATLEDVGGGYKSSAVALPPRVQKLVSEIAAVQRDLSVYRDSQLQLNPSSAVFRTTRQEIRTKIAALNSALDGDMLKMGQISREPDGSYNTQPFHWFTAFYEILNDGGFDVIVGNPPYLEIREVDYKISGYRSLESGAIHAMCIERALQMLNSQGSISMIVPLALVSTQRMKVVQELLEQRGTTWYANYSWRPGKLFDTVNRALTIFVVNHAVEKETLTTPYQKWNSEARTVLLAKLFYIEASRNRPSVWVPKIGESIEPIIVQKCLTIPTKIADFARKTNHKVYYRTTGGLYWKVFTDFAPAFVVDGKQGSSSRETWFTVAEESFKYSIIASLSSNLFWWWYTITSNCRDLNPYDVQNFPLSRSAVADVQLQALGREYLTDLQKNSTMLVRQQKQTGRTETQSFKIQKSKPIIDDIDRVLAAHYGFTAAELDFIINYDIKYRMGRDAAEASEE